MKRNPKRLLAITLALLLALATYGAAGAYRDFAMVKCGENLKCWKLVFSMYANDHEGVYPPLAPYPDLWVPDLRQLYPKYIDDPARMRCPASGSDSPWFKSGLRLPETDEEWRTFHEAFAENYVYLGYAVTTDEELTALVEARRAAVEDGVAELENFERLTRARGRKKEQPRTPVLLEQFDAGRHGYQLLGIPSVTGVLFEDGTALHGREDQLPFSHETLKLLKAKPGPSQ